MTFDNESAINKILATCKFDYVVYFLKRIMQNINAFISTNRSGEWYPENQGSLKFLIDLEMSEAFVTSSSNEYYAIQYNLHN